MPDRSLTCSSPRLERTLGRSEEWLFKREKGELRPGGSSLHKRAILQRPATRTWAILMGSYLEHVTGDDSDKRDRLIKTDEDSLFGLRPRTPPNPSTPRLATGPEGPA